MNIYAKTNEVLNGSSKTLIEKVYQRLAYGILMGKYHYQEFNFSDEPAGNDKIDAFPRMLSIAWQQEAYQSVCTYSQLKNLEDFAANHELASNSFNLWIDIYLDAKNPIVTQMAEEHILTFYSEDYELCYNFLFALNRHGNQKLSIAVQDKFSQVLQKIHPLLTEEGWNTIFPDRKNSVFLHRQIECLAAAEEISSEMANVLIRHLAKCCSEKDWNFNYQQFMADLVLLDGKCFSNCSPTIFEDIEFIFDQGFLHKHFSEAYTIFKTIVAKILLNIDHLNDSTVKTGLNPAYYAAAIMEKYLPADLVLPICEVLPAKLTQERFTNFMKLQRELTERAMNLIPSENWREPKILEYLSTFCSLLKIRGNFIDKTLLNFLLQLAKHPVYENSIAYLLQSYLSSKDYYQQHLLENIFNNGFAFKIVRLHLDGKVLFRSMNDWQGRKSPLFKKIMTMLINQMAADGGLSQRDKANWYAKTEFYNYFELSKELKKDFALMQKEYNEQERQEQEYLDSLL